MRATPYWWDDAQLPDRQPVTPPEDLPDKVDTLIIGAGYSGLCAALTLARAGRDVAVIDAGSVGFGCSSRNGGQIGPSLHKLGLAGLSASLGAAKATAILRESMESLIWLKDFIAREQIDCDLQQAGRFRGACRPAHYEAMARESEELGRAIGLRSEVIPADRQRDHIGSDLYHGGVVQPDDGLLHPAKYVLGLARLATEAGAKIFAPLRASGVQRDRKGLSARAGERRINAGQVLIATNGYSGPELPFFHRRIMPVRSAIIATEPLDRAMVQSCFPRDQAVVDTARLLHYYRPSPDGRRVIFGGRTFDLADRPEKYAPDLRKRLLAIFPQLSEAGVSHAWSGTVAYTFDYAPHLGCHEGLHYVMGYCGSGVGRASYFGHMIALQMLGEATGRTTLDDLPFPTRALYSGTPWFLPAVLRWQSFMDRFGR